ncbi:hypothetical protein BABINDRAFT_99059 [Babjeviella inositovora NRRL Y-12698]|uniref:Uncharacterized protein n=1 Tax=Babjeviella inositovora NRRL Y-12698 TaxID=984486 RepID=A0A1E3QK97_9ASCO|nr:uncharacterized protein BABINDRAFT_99059 [Babjeviella inositovora NRRL Y-12698]ODQ77502.1 hypothetical protein BABINDRAFT_99059 [Babjeviella inositovora NRRL Y-12698]
MNAGKICCCVTIAWADAEENRHCSPHAERCTVVAGEGEKFRRRSGHAQKKVVEKKRSLKRLQQSRASNLGHKFTHTSKTVQPNETYFCSSENLFFT